MKDYARELLDEATVLERNAARLRRAAAMLGGERVGPKTPAHRRKGSRKVCAYSKCGRSFIGRRNKRYCITQHGWLARSEREASQGAPDSAGNAKPKAKAKPVTLVQGDGLRASH